MTSALRRCIHCDISYTYHPSGYCNELNNDRYCPDCYSVVLAALKPIQKKRRKVELPVTEDNPITIEVFKKKYQEYQDSLKDNPLALAVHRLRYNAPLNFEYKELIINDVEYTLVTNKDTGEEKLFVDYEEDTETKHLLGLWRNYSRSNLW